MKLTHGLLYPHVLVQNSVRNRKKKVLRQTRTAYVLPSKVWQNSTGIPFPWSHRLSSWEDIRFTSPSGPVSEFSGGVAIVKTGRTFPKIADQEV